MYLQRLEIQGFKSFAQKNTLVFPGKVNSHQGITSIVGPNGSGKSNVADAVRWALGEQSMKTLRGKKSDDVIFSGSDKKSRLGMAEVSLYLNNEDKKVPLDYSEIVLTRRVYRDGNSEYLLNNSKVRLLDIQMLLAKASVGQKTYSVIGQGLVEGFLNTSLTERKEFFDEATGVKQYQIKRDDSLNKLRASLDNLGQAEMLVNEIDPRLKSLTRQVSKLEKKAEMEVELAELQLNYYRQLWHRMNDRLKDANGRFLTKEQAKISADKKLAILDRELEHIEQEKTINQEFVELQQALSTWQNKRNELSKELNKLEAWLEVRLEGSGQFDLSFLHSRQSELEKEIKHVQQELDDLSVAMSEIENKIKTLTTERIDLDKKLQTTQQTLSVSGSQDNNARLEKLLVKLEQAEMEMDLGKIKQVIVEMKHELRLMLGNQTDLDQTGELQQQLLDLAKQKESLLDKQNGQQLQLQITQEKTRLSTRRSEQLRAELRSIQDKLIQAEKNSPAQAKEINHKKENLVKELVEIDDQIDSLRQKIGGFSAEQEARRERLFEVQRKRQILQEEINSLNQELNSIKIEATRHETRLEDLEQEIRQFGNLVEVKAGLATQELDEAQAQDKISQLRRQLDLIGGIDPAIAAEYNQTKERFDFLTSQSADLNQTIDSLKEIIKELDATIKERFDHEFKIISEKFEEYFKILFNGGRAEIKKVMVDEVEDELNENQSGEETSTQQGNLKKIKFLQKYNSIGLAGIEIMATPPGKKISSISMLSGGERALTAIALICAIIKANPSPFVVLDEVDAALDEANSERLAKILDDLSDKTQFIVITHNRAAMRRASIIYGVTMQDDGVSKLLSIKLEDVKSR
jgi:chromosome segregation protein